MRLWIPLVSVNHLIYISRSSIRAANLAIKYLDINVWILKYSSSLLRALHTPHTLYNILYLNNPNNELNNKELYIENCERNVEVQVGDDKSYFMLSKRINFYMALAAAWINIEVDHQMI